MIESVILELTKEKESVMKKVLLASTLCLFPIAAQADNYATINSVSPIYQDNYVTRYTTSCSNVEVPVYQARRSSSDADVLAGAIVGGAIGNQFGAGSGKDAMTVLGAIVGANRASNRTTNEIVGYRIEERCERQQVQVNEPIVSKYRVEYTYNGQSYTQETIRSFTVGQRIFIQPSLN